MSGPDTEKRWARWTWTEFAFGILLVCALTIVACSSVKTHRHAITSGTGPPIILFVNPTSAAFGPPHNYQFITDEHASYLNDTLDTGGPYYWLFVTGDNGNVSPGGGEQVIRANAAFNLFTPAPGFTNPGFYPGYDRQSPLPTKCSTSDHYANVFDGDYTGPVAVLSDPNGGHPIMLYHAENHCRGATPDPAFYVTGGFTRSLDSNGQSWPTPNPSESARYDVIDGPIPKPSDTALGSLGDSVTSAFIPPVSETLPKYIYAYFIEFPNGGASYVSVARAQLTGSDPPTFFKWDANSTAFDMPATGGTIASPNPASPLFATSDQQGACTGTGSMRTPNIVQYESYYLLVVSCGEAVDCSGCAYPGERGLFYAVADNLATQDWSQLYEAGGFSAVGICTSAPTPPPTPNPQPTNYYQGWYPAVISPSASPGHVTANGVVFEADGCLTGDRVIGVRGFNIALPSDKRVRPQASAPPSAPQTPRPTN